MGDVLEVYTPELTRFLFASTRPNTEFAISFDLDVLKLYEDYDNCERRYFGLLPCNEKKLAMEKRVYELSQVGDVPKTPGYQIPFRHLCNLLQVYSGDIEAVIASLPDVLEDQVERLRTRCRCAWTWITTFSPEDFRFSVAKADTPKVALDDDSLKSVRALCAKVASWDGADEKALSQLIYDAAAEAGVENTVLFTATYLALIGKEKGPKLAGFMNTLGKDRVVEILSRY